jgi:hypothetical protein
MTKLRIGSPPRNDARRFLQLGKNGGHQLSKAETCFGQSTADLLLEHFFDLSDLLLNFAGVFFGISFGL